VNEETERFIDEQERLPVHLQRWIVFDRPKYIWIGRILLRIGLLSLGQRICGLRYETDEERTWRLDEYWNQSEQ
jgi:hypothetical protein